MSQKADAILDSIRQETVDSDTPSRKNHDRKQTPQIKVPPLLLEDESEHQEVLETPMKVAQHHHDEDDDMSEEMERLELIASEIRQSLHDEDTVPSLDGDSPLAVHPLPNALKKIHSFPTRRSSDLTLRQALLGKE